MDNIFPLEITEKAHTQLCESIENWKLLYNIFKDEKYLKNIERDTLALEMLSEIIKKQVKEFHHQLELRIHLLYKAKPWGTSV